MKIAIKNRWTGKIIIPGECESIKDWLIKNRGVNLWDADFQETDLRDADFRGANLRGAYFRGANLRGAYFRGADLRGVNFRGADLRGVNFQDADLRDADLRDADFRDADFRGAKYKEPLFLPDLYSLKLMPKSTKLRFWKHVNGGMSPYQNYEYEVGKIYTEKEYDNDENNSCGTGLNVATLTWCLKDSQFANEFLECEFTVGDIVAVPFSTDGKLRVKRLMVIEKLTRKQAIAKLNKAMGKNTGYKKWRS